MKDDTIRNADDLRKALDSAGLPNVPVFDLTDEKFPAKVHISDIDKRRIQLEALKRSRNDKGHK